jgi:MSHA pilin protein MshD
MCRYAAHIKILRGKAATKPQSSVLCPPSSESGISLVELIMFIVIVSVALAGILLVMNVTNRSSADPLIRKQALAIAESLLEEVELMPFTYCDPDDPAAATASSTADCTAPVGGEVLGVENDVSRYDAALPFDNVSDYHNFHMTAAGGIQDITNNTVLTGYDALVTMTQPGLGGIAGAETLLIKVTVTGPDGVAVVLEGIRTRYSPRI